MSEVGSKAMKTMMEAVAGAPTCGFPPIAGVCNFVYKQTAILLDGKVKVDKSRFLEACEAGVGGSFGDNYLLSECGPNHLGGTSA